MITLTEEQFKEMIEAAHRAGQHNQGHCDPSAYEAMVYYERKVKKLNEPAVSKSEDVEREAAVCIASKDEGCYCKEVDMGCLECKYFRYKQTDC